MNKLETKFKFKIHGKTPEGHISIHHDKEHTIWIFLYSQAGVHESAHGLTEYIIYTQSAKAKKFNETFPTLKEIKNAI